MKYIPILFSTEMVQALIDNRKTQTRRVVQNHPHHIWPDEEIWSGTECFFSTYYNEDAPNKLLGPSWLIKNEDGDIEAVIGKCPYGQPGDILWVRETFLDEYVNKKVNDLWEPSLQYYYKADGNPNDSKGFDKVKWKPSIHMPKEACRLFLKVKSVRVERLQGISEEDAKAEGIEIMKVYVHKVFRNYQDEAKTNGGYKGFVEKAIESFRSLWQSINGEQSWKDNPWVWVIEFERIEKPENFC